VALPPAKSEEVEEEVSTSDPIFKVVIHPNELL
jgi:hypothetical protein